VFSRDRRTGVLFWHGHAGDSRSAVRRKLANSTCSHREVRVIDIFAGPVTEEGGGIPCEVRRVNLLPCNSEHQGWVDAWGRSRKPVQKCLCGLRCGGVGGHVCVCVAVQP
jgi:hypothetical protein